MEVRRPDSATQPSPRAAAPGGPKMEHRRAHGGPGPRRANHPGGRAGPKPPGSASR